MVKQFWARRPILLCNATIGAVFNRSTRERAGPSSASDSRGSLLLAAGAAPECYSLGVLSCVDPACCPDNNGNMTMVFSRSGKTEFGSILYTGRRATDPLGTLQASAVLKAGTAHYARLDDGGRNR